MLFRSERRRKGGQYISSELHSQSLATVHLLATLPETTTILVHLVGVQRTDYSRLRGMRYESLNRLNTEIPRRGPLQSVETTAVIESSQLCKRKKKADSNE